MLTLGAALGGVLGVASGCSSEADGSRGSAASAAPTSSAPPESTSATPTAEARPVRPTPIDFTLGSTLKMEGRVAQPIMLSGAPQEGYILLDLDADEANDGKSPTVDVSLVIDASEGARGPGLDASIAAARAAVRRLADGDSVSVVAFGEKAEVAIGPTILGAATRPRVDEALRTAKASGKACISCGLEQGLIELREAVAARSTTDVQRMVVVSSQPASVGFTSAEDFREITDRARRGRVSISTIGFGTDFDEKTLGFIARFTNGRYAFAEDRPSLEAAVDVELRALDRIVVDRAIVLVDLGPKVELVDVVDRSFSKTPTRVSVALGDFGPAEKKTVLLKVLVPAAPQGQLRLADVRLRYGDVTRQLDVAEGSSLAIDLVSSPADVSLLDGIFLERLQRSDTARAIDEAGALWRGGNRKDAEARIVDGKRALDDRRAKAAITSAPPRAHFVDVGFEAQLTALDRALEGDAKRTLRENEAERVKLLR